MSYNTYGYKKISDLSKERFLEIKKECDKEADNDLNGFDIDEVMELYERIKTPITREVLENDALKFKNKAKEYKENIDSNPEYIKLYRDHIYHNGELYIYDHIYDYYFRLRSYPLGTFTSANKLINEIYRNGHWEHLTFYRDTENGDYEVVTVGTKNRKEAKSRIRKVFSDNPGIIISI